MIILIICVALTYFINPFLPILFGLIFISGVIVSVVGKRKQSKPDTKSETVVSVLPTEAKPDKPDEKELARQRRIEIIKSCAQTDIDYLQPKLDAIRKEIVRLERDIYWRTGDGHYAKTIVETQKEIDKLKDKEYRLTKKLEKAEFNLKLDEGLTGEL